MFDTHMHTRFSTDSKMDILEVIEKSKALDVGVVITEHMDTNYPIKDKFNFDVEQYFNEYEKYRSDKLLLGIELGMSEAFKKKNEDIIKRGSFDQVIGSLHFLGNNDIYDKGTYKGKSKEDAYIEYFKDMISCIKAHSYIDILGHIDYICRYAAFEDKEIYFKDYRDLIEEVIKTCLDNDIIMELNTKRLGNKEAFKNLLPIYKRYKELGGREITIGSDAHFKENIGTNFKEAITFAENIGLKLVYFKNRNKQFI